MLSEKEKQLLRALEPTAQEKGVEIVTIEIVGGKKSPTIRVYIDTDHGVSFDELAASQVWINEIMDKIDPFPGAYTLEVSSPGIDRPLRTIEHFRKALGETVVLKLTGPIDGRSNWTGILDEITDDDVVVLAVEDERVQIPFDNIKRARVKGVVDFSS